MTELAGRILTILAAVGGSTAFLVVLRRWLQRRQDNLPKYCGISAKGGSVS